MVGVSYERSFKSPLRLGLHPVHHVNPVKSENAKSKAHATSSVAPWLGGREVLYINGYSHTKKLFVATVGFADSPAPYAFRITSSYEQVLLVPISWKKEGAYGVPPNVVLLSIHKFPSRDHVQRCDEVFDTTIGFKEVSYAFPLGEGEVI